MAICMFPADLWCRQMSQEKMWGKKLRKSSNCVRSGGAFISDHPGRRQWLEDKGFVFDAHKEKSNVKALPFLHS
jgi:hypothetical protein